MRVLRKFWGALGSFHRTSASLYLFVFLLVCIGLHTGCSSDRWSEDEVYCPNSIGQCDAKNRGLSMLALVSDLIMELPNWVAGQHGCIGGDTDLDPPDCSAEPVWNPDTERWVFADSLVLRYDDHSLQIRDIYKYWVKYNEGGHGRQSPEGADVMLFDLSLETYEHNDGEPAGSGHVSESYGLYWAEGDLLGLSTFPYMYEGSGGMRSSGYATTPSGSEHWAHEVTYELDVEMLQGGCAEGTVNMVMAGGFTMEVTLDGTGGAAWVLKHYGSRIMSGSTLIGCGT